MSWIVGSVAWGGFAAAVFLAWLKLEIDRAAAGGLGGLFPRALFRTAVVAALLVLVALVKPVSIPLALAGFIATRSAVLWRLRACHEH